jgi:hypothetical protein
VCAALVNEGIEQRDVPPCSPCGGFSLKKFDTPWDYGMGGPHQQAGRNPGSGMVMQPASSRNVFPKAERLAQCDPAATPYAANPADWYFGKITCRQERFELGHND